MSVGLNYYCVMKIVLVNYRYFFSGGPERYMFNIKSLLEERGHEVIPFSVQHQKNEFSEYSRYFLSPLGDGTGTYAVEDKSTKDVRVILKGISRTIYSFEAKRKFKNLLIDIRPDLVYILCVQSKMSYSIVDAARELNIPIIHRISDYSLFCATAHYYRTKDNTICELCSKKSLLNCIKYRCSHGSFTFSVLKTIAVKLQNLNHVRDKIDRFIFPSKFTLNKFIEGGYDSSKLIHLPTLFNKKILNLSLENQYLNFALYNVRIDPDKGLITLLDAFIDTEYNLKIIGFSSSGYYESLLEYINGKKHNIEFLGKMDFNEMQKYLSTCLFTIIPSEWYDNLPNTILESYAFSKCVVATNIGSLTENVLDKQTGLLFEYKDSEMLRDKISYLFRNPNIAIKYGNNARVMIDTKFDMYKHTNELIKIFEEVIDGKKGQ